MELTAKAIALLDEAKAITKRHGLPENFSEVDKSLVSPMNELWVGEFVLAENGHIGIYNSEDGSYEADEIGALICFFEYGKDRAFELIERLDKTVPLENTRYTSLSFAIKELLKLGYSRPESIAKTYLMTDISSGHTKIGKSRDPLNRLNQFKCGNPTIELSYVCDCDVETELHRKFAEKRLELEWFNLSTEDINYICRNYNFYPYEPE